MCPIYLFLFRYYQGQLGNSVSLLVTLAHFSFVGIAKHVQLVIAERWSGAGVEHSLSRAVGEAGLSPSHSPRRLPGAAASHQHHLPAPGTTQGAAGKAFDKTVAAL